MELTFNGQKISDLLIEVLPSGPCAFCGNTVRGAAHRVIDAIEERINAGEPADEVLSDYGVTI